MLLALRIGALLSCDKSTPESFLRFMCGLLISILLSEDWRLLLGESREEMNNWALEAADLRRRSDIMGPWCLPLLVCCRARYSPSIGANIPPIDDASAAAPLPSTRPSTSTIPDHNQGGMRCDYENTSFKNITQTDIFNLPPRSTSLMCPS